MSTAGDLPIDEVSELPRTSQLTAYPDESSDLKIAIAKGVEIGRYSNVSAVGLFEASASSKC